MSVWSWQVIRKVKLPQRHASLSSNKNKVLIILETNISIFLNVYYVPVTLQNTSSSLFLRLNIYILFQSFPGNCYINFWVPTQFLVSVIITTTKHSFFLWYRVWYSRKLKKKVRQSPWLPETRTSNRIPRCTHRSYIHVFTGISIGKMLNKPVFVVLVFEVRGKKHSQQKFNNVLRRVLK